MYFKRQSQLPSLRKLDMACERKTQGILPEPWERGHLLKLGRLWAGKSNSSLLLLKKLSSFGQCHMLPHTVEMHVSVLSLSPDSKPLETRDQIFLLNGPQCYPNSAEMAEFQIRNTHQLHCWYLLSKQHNYCPSFEVLSGKKRKIKGG